MMVSLFLRKKVTKNQIQNYFVVIVLFSNNLIEYKKSEVFYFSKATKNFNLSSLNLGLLEELVL